MVLYIFFTFYKYEFFKPKVISFFFSDDCFNCVRFSVRKGLLGKFLYFDMTCKIILSTYWLAIMVDDD